MRKGFLVSMALFVLTAGMLLAEGQGEGAGSVTGFNPTGLPILQEKTEFDMTGILMNNTRQGRHDETDMMKWLEEQTNIKINWNLIPQDSWQEKKNLIVASGDLPDAFHAQRSLSSEDVQKFGADGVIIPLDDLIDAYAPNLKAKMSEPYLQYSRSMDGNLYALAAIQDWGFDSFNAAIINTAWLKKLGLSMPKTTDDFYKVLKAFKTQDPNGNGQADEIPWSFLYKENPPVREVKREHYWIFPAFGIVDNPTHISITDDGEVIFTANKTEWKEAVQYLSKLYKEGLIDPEVFSQDRATLTNKVRNQGAVGSYTDYRLRLSIASPDIQDNFAAMPALTGPHGDKGWMRAMMAYSEGSFAITSNCKSPAALIRWMDYINNDENSVQMSFGMFKPAGYSAAEALVPSTNIPGKYVVNTELRPADVKPSEWPFTAPITVACTLLTSEVSNKYIEVKDSNVAKEEVCAVYRDDLSKYPYNFPFKFSSSEIEELSLIQTDLLNFIYTTEAQWIVSGFSDAKWNTYVKQLDNLGIDRYLELYKTAFNRQK
ncbi:extracellular solute-binding protein [Spirochaeta cellobiosiphila]|uniref:extracellular solute-binding protein n=1 Tax=Spirochaeta cellobiosiphila TaxID=504483 RepID=UPI00040E10D9|nr:extracellular solute-binding protein [Spirochaeta cellobiosiphila]